MNNLEAKMFSAKVKENIAIVRAHFFNRTYTEKHHRNTVHKQYNQQQRSATQNATPNTTTLSTQT